MKDLVYNEISRNEISRGRYSESHANKMRKRDRFWKYLGLGIALGSVAVSVIGISLIVYWSRITEWYYY